MEEAAVVAVNGARFGMFSVNQYIDNQYEYQL